MVLMTLSSGWVDKGKIGQEWRLRVTVLLMQQQAWARSHTGCCDRSRRFGYQTMKGQAGQRRFDKLTRSHTKLTRSHDLAHS